MMPEKNKIKILKTCSKFENMEKIMVDHTGNQDWKLLVLEVCWVLRVNICTSEICYPDVILVNEAMAK